ncbi:MAG: phosphate ABC transporter permease subunit PstC [Bacteroidota bacterium]
MEEPSEIPKFVFSRESLKKKFRLSEFLSEKIITGVAFLSITIIILIFFFVFKESIPIFQSKKKEIAKVETVQKQEQYGTDSSVATNASGQEQYGVEPAGRTNASGQEQYGVTENDSLMTENLPLAEDTVVHGSDEATAKSLLGTQWLPVSDNPRYGLIPLFVGTLKITLIAMLFAAPIAILAALFSAAFAPYWLREIIKPAIELLAGFPSVVIGFFALMVMASFFQNIFGYDGRLNAFVGGVAMALAAIPIIFTITEDALTAVPRTYTEASLALGATRWQTALFVTLPAATPGIFAAILLGIGRVFGETMIALMATGNAAMIGINPFESVRTLAATIGAEMAEVVFGDTHYNVLFLIGSLLFIFTFSLNALAEFYVKGKLVKRFQGKQS